jgi:predicted site-specific integrase-resolvase
MRAVLAPQVTGKTFVTNSGAARMRGISVKTLDRWVKAGIVQPPVVINGRKYHDVAAIEMAGAANSPWRDASIK